jgi:hypothetical protein
MSIWASHIFNGLSKRAALGIHFTLLPKLCHRSCPYLKFFMTLQIIQIFLIYNFFPIFSQRTGSALSYGVQVILKGFTLTGPPTTYHVYFGNLTIVVSSSAVLCGVV